MRNNPKLVAKYNPAGIKIWDLCRHPHYGKCIVAQFGLNQREAHLIIIDRTIIHCLVTIYDKVYKLVFIKHLEDYIL